MEPNVFDKVKDVDLKKTMETSYIDYAMSVIVARALPDVRDGLKPVQRRVLFALQSVGATSDKKTRKCATIVGETMGKYHPHGDSSIYGSLVGLGQPWSTRYPLVAKQGNFGSDDGDPPAAMRYTEAKMSKLADEMLDGINKDTVDFVPNFSNECEEPVILPSRFPNLLVNGTTGIAVGMATNMPPHNLREVISAVDKVIDDKINDKETTIDDIMEKISGPDFPGGSIILGRKGIEEAYRTGRGKIKIRARCEIETLSNGKSRIKVSELPYMVSRSEVIAKIADLVKEKKIDGITNIVDVSGKDNSEKIHIDIRKDANANVILNQLYKHTQIQDSFGVIQLCIVNGEPKVLNILELCTEYLKHQVNVVTRRTKFDLNKCEERAHILEGLLIALDNIDEVIKIVRSAKDTEEAKTNLMTRFSLSEPQSQAIVDMRIRTLTGLERQKLEDEHKELIKKIAYFKSLLADPKKLLGVIKEELNVISDKYGDDRRTEISLTEVKDDEEIDVTALVSDDKVVIAMTNLGYIKRMDVKNFKTQSRGGKGVKGMQTINDDFIEEMFLTTNHSYITFFTNKGKCYRLRALDIPESSRAARGIAIVNLLQLDTGEKIAATVTGKEYDKDAYLIMATKQGIVKKTLFSEYEKVRKTGLIAIVIREDDELIKAKLINDSDKIYLVTKYGKAICFESTQVKASGRTSQGVKGIALKETDEVISMQTSNEGKDLLVVSELGLGKRTTLEEFKVQNRGGGGVFCYKITKRSGNLVGSMIVNDSEDLMMITNDGNVIRLGVSDISSIGRNTSGVKLMDIDSNSQVRIATIAKVQDEEG